MQAEPSVDFDWEALDRLEEKNTDQTRQPRVEFDLAHRITREIAESNNPRLAADQVLYVFGWSKLSSWTFARKHNYSQAGFLKGAQKIAVRLGVKLSESALDDGSTATA